MIWQTKLETYDRFPFCCQHYQDNIDHTDNAYDGQTAFHCARFMHCRIIEVECLGEKCPDCKLVGMDEYLKNLGGVQ